MGSCRVLHLQLLPPVTHRPTSYPLIAPVVVVREMPDGQWMGLRAATSAATLASEHLPLLVTHGPGRESLIATNCAESCSDIGSVSLKTGGAQAIVVMPGDAGRGTDAWE